MLYRKNPKLEFMPSDDGGVVVFDPATDNTIIIPEVGSDILTCIDEPVDIETLLSSLTKMYNVGKEDIRPDVDDFLAQMSQIGVVEQI